jgi:hypothetical protein
MHQFIINIAAQLIFPIEVPTTHLDLSLFALAGFIAINISACLFLHWILNRQYGRILFSLPKRELFKVKAAQRELG